MSARAGIGIDSGQRPVSEILRDVVHDVQDLFRSEVRLAKAEVSEQVDRAKSAGGKFGAAAITGLFAGMCLIAACIALLALTLPVWAAALIMAAILGGVAAYLYSRARAGMRRFHAMPEETIETLRDDVRWLKQRT
jgi:Flp pilus assembly protein TadB